MLLGKLISYAKNRSYDNQFLTYRYGALLELFYNFQCVFLNFVIAFLFYGVLLLFFFFRKFLYYFVSQQTVMHATFFHILSILDLRVAVKTQPNAVPLYINNYKNICDLQLLKTMNLLYMYTCIIIIISF